MRLPTRSCFSFSLILRLAILALAASVITGTSSAQTVYYQIDAGALVQNFDLSHVVADSTQWPPSYSQLKQPARVVTSDGAEVYILEPSKKNDDFTDYKIVGIKQAGVPVSGSLYRLQPHPTDAKTTVLAKYDFRIDDDEKSPATEADFSRAKGMYFQYLWSEEFAGAAMFRHLATQSLAKVNQAAVKKSSSWSRNFSRDVDRTIALMSGGRAVSENLQLDRQLPATTDDAAQWVDVSTIQGITVREMDWKELLAEQAPQLDPLARWIPHDQYVAFVPSFDALVKLAEQGQSLATPLVQAIEPQSRSVDTFGFYQQQLGLPINVLTKQVGQLLIGEVAITGSDPYFRTGTDIAVIMQTMQPELLSQSLQTQIAASASRHRDVTRQERTIAGIACVHWSNPTRTLSSIVAVVGDVVVVANSSPLVSRIVECENKKLKTLAELDEYRFFRSRYPRGNDESAFLMITDATIRKWCGPAWRIAASRRTRARSTIAEVTARHADSLVHQTIDAPVVVDDIDQLPFAGEIRVLPDAVVSSDYGTLRFQTPIAELNLTRVSRQEKKTYEDWRTRYERQWRRAFDPIGLQVKMREDAISFDLSVIPLIMGSEYRWWEGIVGKATLKPDVNDPHPEALASVQLALDTKGWLFAMARQFLTNNTNVRFDIFEWIDDSIEVYLDEDVEWMEMMAAKRPDDWRNSDEFHEMPMGIYVPSKNNVSLTAFMVALRGFLDRVSPNTFESESVEYNGLKYVTLTPHNTRTGRVEPSVYYVTTGDGLTFSFNKKVIQRAIDRSLARRDAKVDKPPAFAFPPQTQLKVTGYGARAILSNRQTHLRFTRENAWSNIAILNHLRGRYPDRDPMSVYEYLFGETLVDPTSGTYVWNPERQTYQSDHHGYPLEPIAGPVLGPNFGPDDVIQMQMSLLGDGVRAKADFQRNGAKR
ncbi:hypothetical protein [Stieleria varia]|uniref:Secreted protein n=1 Tax=Stieleria varia TaxID=2528005 RepID=A0A5C6B273_9BACT|nr:hypothetical protein [Stieleria varia]TWU06233.1 hypothetical protein Pla52n_19530 [Stieleria varia]